MTDLQNCSPEQAQDLTAEWVKTMVVGLNLCPFASPVVKDLSLRYKVSTAKSLDVLTQDYLQELQLISNSPEQDVSTTLLIAPYLLTDFYDYLDTLARFESLIAEADLDGVLQLASFHPGYLFGGVDADDVSHWSNRSPFPMFHIIREAQMSRALTHFKRPEDIPERNIQRLRELGKAGLVARFPTFKDYC